MHVHRPRIAAAALMLAAVIVAGCGSSSSTSSSDDSTALKASDINPMPRSALKQGGVMRWALDEFPVQYNYTEIDGTTDAEAQIEYAVMPRPFRVDPQARITPNTNYVLSASATASKPRQVVTYKLNPKAKWSDGKPITWRDYEAQWKACNGKNSAYQISSSTGYERIASVKPGADEYEVVVTFAKPFGEWQSIFDPLYPASINSDPKKFNTAYQGKIPITGGSFRLKKIDQTAKTITIERNPTWWGEKPLLDTIIFRSLTSDTLVSAVANGEADFASLAVDPSQYKQAKGIAGGDVRQAGGPDFRHFTFNGTGAILKDLKVRQAVAMAINRDVITKADLTGLNWPTRTMGNHFLVNTQEGYADNSGAVGTFDPAKAKATLDGEGWKLDGKYRKKAGKTLELRFVIPSAVAVSRQEGELTQKMLEDVGVKLNVVTVPSDDFFDKYITPGNFDITPFAFLGTPFPISSAQAIYANPKKDAKGELQIQQNYGRVGSQEIDDLMTQAEQELDRTKSFELINKADKLVWDEVQSVIMYQRPQTTAVKSTLANIGSFGLAYKRYEDIGFVK